jgi:tetratricopeptide (TPR) repeat protein
MSQGQQLLDEGRFDDALAWFESHDDIRSRFGRAVALQLLGRFDQAEAAYELVLAADPKHVETLANLIAMNVEKFNLDLVELYSNRLLGIDSGSPIALRGLIVVAVERREYAVAARYFALLAPGGENCRDAVEYRLSRRMVERLKHHPLKDPHGSTAYPY